MKMLVINDSDNVAVSLADGAAPRGHKLARRNIKMGDAVIKYGEIIGRATADIKEGEWVHSHNLRSHLDETVEYLYQPTDCAVKNGHDSFMGYRRPYGETGIRNEIYIIPTVGCVNQVCIKMCGQAQKLVGGTLDGIYTFTHQFGCSQLGEDNENIKKLLCAAALNPNAAFVLFVGLGCENNGLDGIREYLAPFNRDNIEFFNCQDVEDEISYGLNIIERFAERAKEYKREERPYSELKIGLKCGGSDGFSGITANPLVGTVTDRVIASGGSAVLTEVPEMFGAEQILMNRCESAEVFEAYKKMITDFKKYYTDRGFPVYENPSPGNKAGGITTLEEKSLGCIKKGGSTAVVDVLGYGERVRKTGLSVLDAPGNDLIAATALAAAGCQIVLFTTGRGTPFSTFVPTMKISTNEALAGKKNGWIDFSAHTMDAEGLYDLIKRTVNGEYICKSEQVREIAFYKTGVTL